jgi:hypothetical protein
MNKLFHIIFTLYFTVISSGVLFSKHICGDRVSRSVYGISIDSENNCCCSHDSAEHNKGCCKSETTVIKAETQKFSVHSQFNIWKTFELNLLYTHTFVLAFKEFEELNYVVTLVHPPPKPPTYLFIYNKSLLI